MDKIPLSKRDLDSPSKFKEKLSDYVINLRNKTLKSYSLEFDIEEMADLLLSVCRINDFNVICEKGNRIFFG